MADPRTGTKLQPFEQAIANVQNELAANNTEDLGYSAPVSNKISKIMTSIIRVGKKKLTLEDFAKNSLERKLGEMPGVQEFRNTIEGTVGGYEKYAAGLLPDLSAAEETVQDLKSIDLKSMVVKDVANKLKIPDEIKQDILAGTEIGDSTKNYLVDKLNNSTLPLNIDRQRGDAYRVSKDFALGNKATIGVSEYLNSNRPAEVQFGYNSGNFSASANKTASRRTEVGASYGWNATDELGDPDPYNNFSAGVYKKEGRRTQANVSYNWTNPDKNSIFGISANTEPRFNAPPELRVPVTNRKGEIEFTFEKKLGKK